MPDEGVAAGKEVYRCKECHRTFHLQRALGGHVSKAHPGSSNVYNHKKLRSQQLEPKRRARIVAKRLLRDASAKKGDGHKTTDVSSLIKIINGKFQPRLDQVLSHEKAEVDEHALAMLIKDLKSRREFLTTSLRRFF